MVVDGDVGGGATVIVATADGEIGDRGVDVEAETLCWSLLISQIHMKLKPIKKRIKEKKKVEGWDREEAVKA